MCGLLWIVVDNRRDHSSSWASRHVSLSQGSVYALSRVSGTVSDVAQQTTTKQKPKTTTTTTAAAAATTTLV
jgi:hypothetical protein